jgi:hypothetical protein
MSFGILKKEGKVNEEEKNENINRNSKINEQGKKSGFFEGWIKYLHYNEADKLRAFFMNSFFIQQMKNPQIKNLDKKDKVLT